MKIFKILMIFSFVVLTSCGGGGRSDDTPIPVENRAPSKVSSVIYPSNNLLCIDNTLSFEWSASSDPDGDTIKYLLEISTDNQFTALAYTSTNSSTTKTVTLEKGKAYYWRIKAIDSENLSSDYSSVNQFYTEGLGVVNHIPFSPAILEPLVSEAISGTSVNLKWNASDVDGDDLIFDVYLDSQNPPTTKVGENIADKTLNTPVSSGKNYYWRVVVKDGNGGEAIGQVWNFSVD